MKPMSTDAVIVTDGSTGPSEGQPGDDASEIAVAPRLITIVGAAKVLGVSRTTVYELVRTEQLEVVHIGRSVRVPVDAIDRYVARLRDSRARSLRHRMRGR